VYEGATGAEDFEDDAEATALERAGDASEELSRTLLKLCPRAATSGASARIITRAMDSASGKLLAV
jgi:hypothetical protein